MFIILLTSLAFSQENNRQIKYQKETQIDFEALDIEGELIKPQGLIIQERVRAQFNPLIPLRTDWNKEMSDSIRAIK